MPDIHVHGVLHRGITWEEAERLAKESEPPELAPEDAKRLGEKMQQQADLGAKLDAAGIGLDDLFVEGDDEPSDYLDEDFTPREYDFEGALRDLDAREAREREERGGGSPDTRDRQDGSPDTDGE